MSSKVVLSDDKIAIVVAMKNKGCSYREIVNATGCSEWSIRKYCNDNGLSTKEQSRQAKEQIEVLLAEGYPKKEIAKTDW